MTTERLPIPFRFSLGAPFDHGNFIMVGGEVVWGDDGWFVSNGIVSYQAPKEQDQAAAVLEWLRRVLGVGEPTA